MTVFSIFFVLITLILGTLAVDFSRKSWAEAELQLVSDSVAHAALVSRQDVPADVSVTTAVALGALNSDYFAGAVTDADVVFGHWDKATRTFTPDPASRKAVQVFARREKARNNFVEGVFSHVLGIIGFEIGVESIMVAETHHCASNGIVAENRVDFTSQNTFGPGYCIHSDDTIDMTSNNAFGDEAVVSLPSTLKLTTNIDDNPGLSDALEELPARLDVPYLYNNFSQSLLAGDPDYIPTGTVLALGTPEFVAGAKSIDPGQIVAGQTHVFQCGTGNGKLSFSSGSYSNFILITNCRIAFNQGAILENGVILQSNTSGQAITAANGVQFGRNDNCAEGGGVTVFTKGDVHVAAQLEMYGSTIAALGSVMVAAKADGMMGASIIAGGDAIITSQGAFGACPGQRNLPWKTFRFVK